MTQEVAVREPAPVPALVQTPALQMDAQDIALPRIYIGQFMSKPVQNELAKMGDIYSAENADDADPQILWSSKGKGANPGVLFHVLTLRKGKSYSEPGGELELYDFNDPSAPEKAWVTYNFMLACPEIDPDLPFKLTLTRTGKPAAVKVTTVLMRGLKTAPGYNFAFRLTSAEREKQNVGKYAVAQVSTEDAKDENVKLAEQLFLMVNTSNASAPAATGEEPQI